MYASAALWALMDRPFREAQPIGFRPSYVDLLRVFNTYTSRQDLRPGVANECAVRMSVALSLSGFSFEVFPERNRVRSGGGTGIPVAHVLGARELADYLQQSWGRPDIYTGASQAAASGGVAARPGVIFFNNCFQRAGETSRSGDHIDLWTGYEYYNQVLSLAAGREDRTSTGRLFTRGDAVWFWPLN